jgi:nucleotide-binding universal stress UspA family protein
MFSKIVVALNELPESQRALQTAVDLARSCNAELATALILGDLPAYFSFSVVIDPSIPAAMIEQRWLRHEELHKKAANRRESAACTHKEQNADLLVLGLHQHDFYLSRLWSSAYDLAQDATCSVLGVH